MLDKKEEIIKGVFITEEEADKKLSLLDIKAAIAEQSIPVSELYTNQDLASNEAVIVLVQSAETKTKQTLTQKNAILKTQMKDLQSFKDKTDTLSLVKTSKSLTDKSARTIEYINARLSSGRGVDLSGDLTDDQRQDEVNKAIEEELALIDSQGIAFKSKKEMSKKSDKTFQDDTEEVDMTDPENNPLIPTGDEDE